MYGVLSVLALCLGSALAQANDVETELSSRGHYTVFLDLLRQTGAINRFKQAAQITLFAPTDEALNRMPAGAFNDLINNAFLLNATMFYHAIFGKSLDFTVQDQDVVLTSSIGLPIRINVYELLNVYAAEGLEITEKDIKVVNGEIHGIDGLMAPPMGNIAEIAGQRGDMYTLATLAVNAGIVNTVLSDMNLTVFAPTDAAFQKVSPDVMAYLNAHPQGALRETLMYHFITDATIYTIGMKDTMTFPSGDGHHDDLVVLEDASGGIFINHARITERDISATNGVIHMIDDVLIPARVLIEMENAGVNVG